jgi:hypothetical protein
MMNSAYHFNRMRELFEEFEPSRERSLAITKLEECQMWLAKCKPTVDALKRDLHAQLFDYQADEGTPTQALEKELRAKLFEGFDDPATD